MAQLKSRNPRLEGFGQGAGPYKAVEGAVLELVLSDVGIDVQTPADQLQDGFSPNLVDVSVHRGLSSANDLAVLGSAYGGANKQIMAIREYQTKSLTDSLVRMRIDGWDRWDGSTWTTLGGAALTGTVGDRIYSASMQNLLIATNGVDTIKSWDGNPAHNVQDLDAGAPVARFIAPMGQRLVAARVKTGGAIDPYLVLWSADGDVTEWADAVAGAGSVILEPEGATGLPDFITGLSAMETMLVIYREQSIVVGTRTGIAAAPFRFATAVSGMGTKSPYTIRNGGPLVGDLFLGHDLNVYLFNGRDRPTPVGDPIWPYLREAINDPNNCVATIDRRRQEYWLGIPTGSSSLMLEAWILRLPELKQGKVKWTRRMLSTGYRALGFGRTAPGSDPLVDSVATVVDATPYRVDAYENTAVQSRVLLGDDVGQVRYLNPDTYIDGSYDTRPIGEADTPYTIDRVTLSYQADVTATGEISVSVDGGLTWSVPRTFSVSPTTQTQAVSTWHQVTGIMPQIRVKFLTGQLTVSKIRVGVIPRSRTY